MTISFSYKYQPSMQSSQATAHMKWAENLESPRPGTGVQSTSPYNSLLIDLWYPLSLTHFSTSPLSLEIQASFALIASRLWANP